MPTGRETSVDPAKSREDAEDRFWKNVKDLLTKEHRHKPDQAKAGIAKYKQEAKRLGGDAVFNQGEERTAEAIHRAINSKPNAPSARSKRTG